MIHLSLAPPPSQFDTRVRNPGRAFLAVTPAPTSREWSGNDFWRRAHDDLYRLNRGLCAYCASWTPRRRGPGVDHTSVDHYIPKSRNTGLAYEWTNFRLARSKLNGWKGDWQDVLDPVSVQSGWFTLNFTTFLIFPGAGLQAPVKQAVEATIKRLRLNAETDYVNERTRAVYRYSAGVAPFSLLQERYPFIAQEMQRQSFDTVFRSQFQQAIAKNPQFFQQLLT